MILLEILFFFFALLILYTYFGYPVILFAAGRIKAKPVNKHGIQQNLAVSVVIAARNEENKIRSRIVNILEQDYPEEKLEIVLVSDGSTDDTVNTIKMLCAEKQYFGRQVKILEYSPSQGKPNALNQGLIEAKGDIVVFADCRQIFSKDAIKNLVSNFADKGVGGVSGELLFVESDNYTQVKEMGVYWHYEKTIRKLESLTGSVIGATGAIYAIRRKLFQPIPPEILLDDVLIPLQIVKQGYRIVFDGSAKAYDTLSADVNQEWQRKLRTLAGNWQLAVRATHIFNPADLNVIWRFISHKFLRLIVPFMLLYLYAFSFILQGKIFLVFAVLQTGFYLLAFATARTRFLKKFTITRLCYFFCILNAAAFFGFWYWVSGRSESLWVVNRSQNSKQ